MIIVLLVIIYQLSVLTPKQNSSIFKSLTASYPLKIEEEQKRKNIKIKTIKTTLENK